MKPALDLSRYHTKRETGELVVYTTWFYEGNDVEPALVLMKTGNKGKPCVIPLSSAYAYDDPAVGHKHLLTMSKLFNAQLGFNDTMMNVHKVADAIHGSLLDLIQTPPVPTQGDSKVVADMLLTNLDGKTKEIEVREDV